MKPTLTIRGLSAGLLAAFLIFPPARAETVLVADPGANQVEGFTSTTAGSWTSTGVLVPSGSYAGGALATPFGLAVRGSKLYVAEAVAGGRLLEFTTSGTFVRRVYTFPSTAQPRYLAFGPDGTLFVTDAFGTSGDNVWRIDLGTSTASVFITTAAGAFNNPQGLVFAPDGKLYVADRQTNRIKQFSSGGALLNANFATVTNPIGLAWDATNNRFLSGAGFSGDLVAVSTSGVVTTILNQTHGDGFLDAVVLGGQTYVSRYSTTAANAGVYRMTGATTATLVTGTNFSANSAAQMAVVPADTDADGLPDSWEIACFILPGENAVTDAATILARYTGSDDPDGDGLANSAEFAAATNPMAADTDNDGLSDAVETGTGTWVSAADTGTKPTRPDSDGDGLSDGLETGTGTYISPADTGTNPNLADSDGDTFGDYLEIARASNPTLNTSTPAGSGATPLVDLNAASLAPGSLSAWTNAGTLGRDFLADSAPAVETLSGVQGVTFSGTQVLTGPAAPPDLTGSSPRTIQAWIFNPTTSTEETIVGWGRRDGPNGSSCAFFHGTDAAFGAVGNWGTPDMSWGPDAPSIAANVKLGSWTYVAYTYDGGGTNVGTVYSNGTLANTEALGALATLATGNTLAAPPLPIRVAGQNAADGSLAATGQKGSLTIARLKIYDRVLGAGELGLNDSDSDGMKDWYEAFYGLNPAVDDSADDPDHDGLTNLQEQTGGTNPSIADSDADGLPDGWEVAHFGNQASGAANDPDGDGATNLMEFQATHSLTIQRDLSGHITGTTPVAGNSDPNDANSQPDDDEDGLPDGWEKAAFGNTLSYGAPDDPDSDGFDNLAEFLGGSNPSNINSTPSDTDADGLADAWEIAHFTTIAAQNGSGDPDGDLCTNLEEFTASSDPNDPNSQPDSDGDGIADGWERLNFGNLARDGSGDFDNDTYSDLAEFTAGSNPQRPGNTPANVHATVTVAVANGASLDEWSVTDKVWTLTRTISPGVVDTVVFHQGFFYGVGGPDVVKIDPVSGTRTVLATRNTGEALMAGWTDSTARDLEVGPDGKLYFTTAFGLAAGEGLFRVNTDGTSFERFIARTGGTAPNTWDLNNSIGLAWIGNDLYVSSRATISSTNRPIYKFDTSGALVSVFKGTLTAPMGLCPDGDDLVVGGAVNTSALVSLKLSDASVSYTKSGVFAIDVVNILGELHAITFNSGTGGHGSILKAGPQGAMTVVNNDLVSTGSDLVVFDLGNPDSDGDGLLDAWENTHFGNLAQTASGDPDGDGTSNLAEQALRLDPNNPNARFAATASGTPSSGLTLIWPSQAGLAFTVRSSTDLTDWSTVEATVPAAAEPAATTSWNTGPIAPGGHKFYRVEFTP